jgi:hypothetical protein
VDLAPLVLDVEHVGAHDTDVRTALWQRHVRACARAEVGDRAAHDGLALAAARLVGRDDLDVDATLLHVLRVEHRRVRRVRCQVEVRVAILWVVVRLLDRPDDRAARRVEEPQPLGVVNAVQRV